MENIGWEKILFALGVVGGAITAGVPFFKWIAELVDAQRKARQAKKQTDLSRAAEFRKLENDDRAQINEDLWQIIEAKNKDCERLEKKIEQLEQTHSLPRPVMTRIYQGMRRISRQVENIRILVERGEQKENVIIEIDILEQNISEVDQLLP